MIPGCRLHHVGWAVADLQSATEGFAKIGYVLEPMLPDTVDENFGVSLRFLRLPGHDALIELVQPVRDDSSVSAVIQRSGAGPYHLGYCVDDIAVAGVMLRACSFRPTTGRLRAPALGKREIQFFHRRDIGLIELIEWPTTSLPT